MGEELEYLPVYAAQSLLDIIIAAILFRFYRSYRSPYLLHWSLSWWSLAAYHVTIGATYWLTFHVPPDSALRTIGAISYMSFGLLQVVWLLQGTWELLTGRAYAAGWMLPLRLGLVTLAAYVVLASVSATAMGRLFSRLGLLSLVVGIAFMAAGLAIVLMRARASDLGRRLVSWCLFGYGLLRLPYFVATGSAYFGIFPSVRVAIRQSYAFLDLLDFLLQASTGIGMVIWLLENEREKLLRAEERVRQSQRLEAVGRLVGGIAHDFNNLLTVILGHAELLVMRLTGEDRLRSDAEQIQQAAERASSLTNQLLAFGRKQTRRPHLLNLNDVVFSMEEMLERLLPQNVRLETRLATDLANVNCDPSQVEQVVMNLALNARDAMPSGGTLTLQTRNHAIDRAPPVPEADYLPRPHAVLSVSDTGVGMDAETKRHIFEPFFTTKTLGEGTGLGLSTLYGIVKQNDGHVTVRSEPGVGSCFEVYLPALPESVGEPPGPPVPNEEIPGPVPQDEDIDRVRS